MLNPISTNDAFEHMSIGLINIYVNKGIGEYIIKDDKPILRIVVQTQKKLKYSII